MSKIRLLLVAMGVGVAVSGCTPSEESEQLEGSEAPLATRHEVQIALPKESCATGSLAFWTTGSAYVNGAASPSKRSHVEAYCTPVARLDTKVQRLIDRSDGDVVILRMLVDPEDWPAKSLYYYWNHSNCAQSLPKYYRPTVIHGGPARDLTIGARCDFGGVVFELVERTSNGGSSGSSSGSSGSSSGSSGSSSGSSGSY